MLPTLPHPTTAARILPHRLLFDLRIHCREIGTAIEQSDDVCYCKPRILGIELSVNRRDQIEVLLSIDREPVCACRLPKRRLDIPDAISIGMLPEMQRNVLAIRRIVRGSLDLRERVRGKDANVRAARRCVGVNVPNEVRAAEQIICDDLVDDRRIVQRTISGCFDNDVGMVSLSSSNDSRENVVFASTKSVSAARIAASATASSARDVEVATTTESIIRDPRILSIILPSIGSPRIGFRTLPGSRVEANRASMMQTIRGRQSVFASSLLDCLLLHVGVDPHQLGLVVEDCYYVVPRKIFPPPSRR
jgi:hypothetical protein